MRISRHIEKIECDKSRGQLKKKWNSGLYLKN